MPPPPVPTPPTPPPRPTAPGHRARSTSREYAGNIVGEVAAAAVTIPMLLRNPVEGVERIANAHDRRGRLWQALLINTIGWLLVTVPIVLKMPASTGFSSRLADLGRLTALLLLPFVALTVSCAITRRLASAGCRHGLGYDALGAASALLPVQTASLLMVMFGPGGWTLWFIACAMLLAALIVQSVQVQNASGRGVTRMIFLTPLQLTAAILMTVELLGKFLPHLLWFA